MEQEQIFRKKSMDRISSPEQLNDYIRVTTPSVWVILAAAVVLLAGAIVWACFGTIEINTGSGTEYVAPISFILG